MTKIFWLALFSLIVVALCSCDSSNEKAPESKAVHERVSSMQSSNPPSQEKEMPTIGQAEFEQRLGRLGVKIYEGATFDCIEKTKDGYQITYILPKSTEAEVKKVHEYYQTQLRAIAKKKGLKQINMGNLMMFTNSKGNVIFSCANSLNVKGDKHLLIIELSKDLGPM